MMFLLLRASKLRYLWVVNCLIACSTLTLVSIFQTQLGYAQIETNSTMVGTGYTQLDTTYFSFQYPTGWIVDKQGLTAPEPFVTLFDQEKGGAIIVFTSPTDLENYGIPRNSSQQQIESNLEKVFPRLLNASLNGDRDSGATVIEVESPNYDRYMLDGHRSGSALSTVNVRGQDFKEVAIATVIGNNGYGLEYKAAAPFYDESIVDTIVKSLKINQ